jgi:hypothetical protein
MRGARNILGCLIFFAALAGCMYDPGYSGHGGYNGGYYNGNGHNGGYNGNYGGNYYNGNHRPPYNHW